MPVTAFIRSLSQRFSRNRRPTTASENSQKPLSSATSDRKGSNCDSSNNKNGGVSLIPAPDGGGIDNVAMLTSATTSESVSLSSAATFSPGAIPGCSNRKPLANSHAAGSHKASRCSSITTTKRPSNSSVMTARFVDPTREFVCRVHLLDGTAMSVVLPRKALAKDLYDKVFGSLELEECDYFGLQFINAENGFQQWLDPLKKIMKQLLPIEPPYTFHFRVKFYSSEPNNLREEFTRYQFFLQLKIDVLTGRLDCPREVAIELAALSLQSEFGDYTQDRDEVFVSEFRFHPQQDEAMELAILEHYRQKCLGLMPEQAERAFLNRAKWLEFYGVDMHLVEGRDGNKYSLGLTPSGILVFDGRQKIGLFLWEKIQRLDFKSKKITLVVEEDDLGHSGQIQLHTFVFNLACARASKHFWKCAIEHHMFFRFKINKVPKQRSTASQLFRFGSTFKYRGRTEFENVHKTELYGDKQNKAVHREPSKIQFDRRASQRFAPRESHIRRKQRQQQKRHSVIVALDETGIGKVITPLMETECLEEATTDRIAKKEPEKSSWIGTLPASASINNDKIVQQESSPPRSGQPVMHNGVYEAATPTDSTTTFPITVTKSGSRIPSLIPTKLEPVLNGKTNVINPPNNQLKLTTMSSGYESGSLKSVSTSSSNIPRPTNTASYVTTIKIKEFGIANGVGVAPPAPANQKNNLNANMNETHQNKFENQISERQSSSTAPSKLPLLGAKDLAFAQPSVIENGQHTNFGANDKGTNSRAVSTSAIPSPSPVITNGKPTINGHISYLPLGKSTKSTSRIPMMTSKTSAMAK